MGSEFVRPNSTQLNFPAWPLIPPGGTVDAKIGEAWVSRSNAEFAKAQQAGRIFRVGCTNLTSPNIYRITSVNVWFYWVGDAAPLEPVVIVKLKRADLSILAQVRLNMMTSGIDKVGYYTFTGLSLTQAEFDELQPECESDTSTGGEPPPVIP